MVATSMALLGLRFDWFVPHDRVAPQPVVVGRGTGQEAERQRLRLPEREVDLPPAMPGPGLAPGVMAAQATGPGHAPECAVRQGARGARAIQEPGIRAQAVDHETARGPAAS